jgi:hypothetical protein
MENLETENQVDLELLAEHKIRSELNLEKWSFWIPTQSHRKIEEKKFERELYLTDGSIKKATLTIKPSTDGNLTTQDQKVFYALIKIWETKGKSKDYTYFSLRQLAKVLKVSWGKQIIKTLTNSIERLRLTHFIWEHSYYNAETKNTLEVLEDPFTILGERKLVKRKENGITTKEEGYFKFHELILGNLLANYTKPVLLDVVISFKSEIAQMIYSKVDLFLSDNPRYERRTKELFEDLGLKATAYRYSSKRKQMLVPALAELLGKPLSNGGMIGKANLELTKDGTDLKVVFEKRQKNKNFTLPESQKARKPEIQVEEKLDLTDEEKALLTQILEYGVTEPKALDVLKRTKTALERQIMYYPYLSLSSAVNNPAGWILRAIEKDYAPPTSYKKEAEAKKAKIEFENRNREEQKRLQRQEARFEATERKKELAKGKYLSLPKERQDELYKIYYDKITKRDYKPEHLKLEFVQGLLTQQILTEIYSDIAKGKIT